MTITLTMKEHSELWNEAFENTTKNLSSEPYEIFGEIPKQLGKGSMEVIELYPTLKLAIFDYEYLDDVVTKIPDYEHPLQFRVHLSGKIIDEHGRQVGEGYTLISGSGIQRKMTIREFQRVVGVDIEMSSDLLRTFFPTNDGKILPELDLLVKDNDWQTLLYPRTTIAIEEVARQIVNCPYQGVMKRMYLQAKVVELMSLQLTPLLAGEGGVQKSPRLKKRTIARIHHAREILLSRLENPPSLVELGQQVGVSDRTLRYGFRELFGTTVFTYLTDKRMEQAEQLLREGKLTVAEVANLVGYCHLGHFAAAFKRKFGITPSDCLWGGKSLCGS
ncbi:AraC family transcriptional regulator [Brasilonema octagenarum UFV-E1]|uniref:AraC family transcriptional regulator n=2 Tax=Bromeliae group (in: Brasilonema) TaxID=3398495 RepID=A0A856MKR8_9CYAN|nr:AraC family transcriptional regulator [Brasilonema sennae CENA114]QDL18348.1 AraC family transcriptional regulator [Brasilonema octagenarum UFV-E1]